MEIIWDNYGLTFDTEWLYIAVNKWLVLILVAGFIGYKIYNRKFYKF